MTARAKLAEQLSRGCDDAQCPCCSGAAERLEAFERCVRDDVEASLVELRQAVADRDGVLRQIRERIGRAFPEPGAYDGLNGREVVGALLRGDMMALIEIAVLVDEALSSGVHPGNAAAAALGSALRRHEVVIEWGNGPAWACSCGERTTTSAAMVVHLKTVHGRA